MTVLNFPVPHDGSFDPGIIGLMSTALEETWAWLQSTGAEYEEHEAQGIRDLLAAHLIGLVKAGERDPERLGDTCIEFLIDHSRSRLAAWVAAFCNSR